MKKLLSVSSLLLLTCVTLFQSCQGGCSGICTSCVGYQDTCLYLGPCCQDPYVCAAGGNCICPGGQDGSHATTNKFGAIGCVPGGSGKPLNAQCSDGECQDALSCVEGTCLCEGDSVWDSSSGSCVPAGSNNCKQDSDCHESCSPDQGQVCNCCVNNHCAASCACTPGAAGDAACYAQYGEDEFGNPYECYSGSPNTCAPGGYGVTGVQKANLASKKVSVKPVAQTKNTIVNTAAKAKSVSSKK